MKSVALILFFVMIASVAKLTAQWEKVYTNSTWPNSNKLYSHKNVLFLSGNYGEQILRTSDNGTNWTDITSSFKNDIDVNVLDMLSFGNTVFAVTDSLGGPNDYFIYASIDDGVTWAVKSIIDRGPNNGAILSLAADGNNLFAISNKRSIYKSTDGGETWVETVINYTGNFNGTSAIVSFAASGNTYLATLEGDGAIISTDAGLNWTLKNSTNNKIIYWVYKVNNDIWGFTTFSAFDGIYKYNLSTNEWGNNYLPGSFYIPISIATNGTQLISSFSGFLTSDTRYYSSNNNGTSWSELTTDTIGLGNKILSPYALAVNSSYYFAAYWKFANSVVTAGVYRLPLTTTSLTSEKSIPNSYHLSQNYPNPFNPSTTISWQLAASSFVTLKVHNVLGKEVAALVNEEVQAGMHSVNFDASHLSSGIYFYTLKTNSFMQTKKMILLR